MNTLLHATPTSMMGMTHIRPSRVNLWTVMLVASEAAVRHHYAAPWRDDARRSASH